MPAVAGNHPGHQPGTTQARHVIGQGQLPRAHKGPNFVSVYGLARVDRSGRVADRTVTGALGWRGGDRLTLTAEAGVVVIRRDPSGLVTLPPRSCVPIPATLRHRCGLLPGDPVLLAARPAEDTLTAYSLAVVDQALAAHIPFPALKEETDDDHRT
jgi:hypothetical protein